MMLKQRIVDLLVTWLFLLALAACLGSGCCCPPAASGAPVPRPPPPPPPLQVTPGTHTLHWSGTPYKMTIDADHRYEALSMPKGSSRYYGSWRWCPDKRMLVISETFDEDHGAAGDYARQLPIIRPPTVFKAYVIKLDRELRGTAEPPNDDVTIRVEPGKKRKKQ